MAAPDAKTIERALAAGPRQFHSVKAALLWYRRQLDARLRTARAPEDIGTPRNAEAGERAAATFAAIAGCLSRVHSTDPSDPDEAAAVRFRVSGEMLCWLVAWYEGDGWGDGSWLAERAKISRWAFRRRCLATERVLRRRLESIGVVEP